MYYFRALIIILISVFTYQCKSSCLNGKPPFNVTKATYHNWYGGQPGVEGIVISISIKTNENVVCTKVIFANEEVATETYNDKNNLVIIGRIKTSKKSNNTLNYDLKENVSNKDTLNEKKTSLKLKANEALLFYTHKNKEGCYKITKIEKSANQYYQ